ncbi:cytochrome P450 [Pseudonocardia dioxanivorans]|uniref:cytochrome P450 n=1 Tax=Pseudonocardia dioxanivorans TaxID=240495 RepID=UPI000CD037F8|nr:cytochrome P450 [Pseudonocardia dioxanivorans]
MTHSSARTAGDPPADPRPGALPALPEASAADTARVLALAVGPIVAQGVIARRRRVVALAGRFDTDARGVRALQVVRDRYGPGPVRLRVPGRRVAVVLDPQDVATVLEGAPEPFAPANREKRGALRHFQPHGVLVSSGQARAQRRTVNEAVLDTGHPLHENAAAITHVVRQEAAALRAAAVDSGVLDWDAFMRAWWRVVRRVVLGDGARDDDALTDDLTRLRRAGNWSGLHPRNRHVRERMRQRLAAHLGRAEPGSLAAVMARTPVPPGTDAVDQVPQWLFAFDPAGAVALRALALVAAHPGFARCVRDDLAERDATRPQELPLLRAAVLESARLWPTTPLLLRDTVSETRWARGALPAGTALLIPTWYLHRNDARPDAHRFSPDGWLDGTYDADPAIVPFSAGPAHCPGRELVLLTASTMLATLVGDLDLTVRPAGLLVPGRPLPGGLDPFTLRFAVRGRADA